jgi:hypothetical protein
MQEVVQHMVRQRMLSVLLQALSTQFVLQPARAMPGAFHDVRRLQGVLLLLLPPLLLLLFYCCSAAARSPADGELVAAPHCGQLPVAAAGRQPRVPAGTAGIRPTATQHM